MSIERALVWFRRDLRDFDHAALAAALRTAREVHCAFVFDREILDALPDRSDRRVAFIHASVHELDAALRARGGGLVVLHGRAREEIPRLARELHVEAVFANRDYEPTTRDRDSDVARTLDRDGIAWHAMKDQVLFDEDEILTQSGRPHTVFTPYRNAWRKRLAGDPPVAHRCDDSSGALARPPAPGTIPALAELGFDPVDLHSISVRAGMRGATDALQAFLAHVERYDEDRDRPAVPGTSRLSVHLRFGTTSVRVLAAEAQARAAARSGGGASKWLDELAWRDFYAQLLFHFPHVVGAPFKPAYAALQFRDDPQDFAAWCEGRTGYPFIDAGMRELNTTGWMHNRLRMVTASFLVKDLLVDWRRGERYFARQLIDYDLASNNGGWQWAASTGCDAQPWFRIFNPVTQSERFDAAGEYIRRFVPELARLPAPAIHAPWQADAPELERCGVVLGRDYPAPIVDHRGARQRALAVFGAAKRQAEA